MPAGAFRITTAQFAALGAPSVPFILNYLLGHITEQFPDIALLGDPAALANEAIRRADRYGFATLSGYAHFVNFIALGGPDFDRRHLDPTSDAIRSTLKTGEGDDGFERIYALLERGAV